MTTSCRTDRAASLLAVALSLVAPMGHAQNPTPAPITAIVAVEPTARKAAHTIVRSAAESGLSKAAGGPVTLATSEDLADVMRATRSAGYDVFIGPAQVAASALQRGYELVGSTHKSEKYLLVGVQSIASVQDVKGRRLYLPQQDSIYTYMARRGAVLAAYREKSLKDVAFNPAQDDFQSLDKVAGLDKAKPVIFACNGAECWKSYKAAKVAAEKGYKSVYWLRGGLPEWIEAGLPTEGG